MMLATPMMPPTAVTVTAFRDCKIEEISAGRFWTPGSFPTTLESKRD